MKLLTSQKNQLYDLISNYKYFTPSQFKYVEGADIIGIEFDQESYFKIYHASDSYDSGHF